MPKDSKKAGKQVMMSSSPRAVRIGVALNNRGSLLQGRGQLDEAEALLLRAVKLRE